MTRRNTLHTRHRLFWQVYLAFFGIALLCVLAAGVTARALGPERSEMPQAVRAGAEALAAEVDAAGSLEDALLRTSDRVGMDLTLRAADGSVLASTAPEPLEGPSGPRSEGMTWSAGRGGAQVHLPDGRWLAGRLREPRSHGWHFAAFLALILAVAALGCWPLARRITRRLESLEHGVAAWGAGDLGARVPVEGRDEVARLAERFNEAAARVEQVVEAQGRALANASHELRSPLARLRMALELLGDDATSEATRRKLMEDAEGDIGELDGLIGEILLAARLDAGALVPAREAVDLGALAREVAERAGATVSGDAGEIDADPTLIARALRNLLDNARRHGGDGPVEVLLERTDDEARVVVSDRGPGVPEPDRERIFEPFYRPSGRKEGRGGGVGLGLALVRDIARRHGGRVWVEPREGGGGRFVLALPTSGS